MPGPDFSPPCPDDLLRVAAAFISSTGVAHLTFSGQWRAKLMSDKEMPSVHLEQVRLHCQRGSERGIARTKENSCGPKFRSSLRSGTDVPHIQPVRATPIMPVQSVADRMSSLRLPESKFDRSSGARVREIPLKAPVEADEAVRCTGCAPAPGLDSSTHPNLKQDSKRTAADFGSGKCAARTHPRSMAVAR